METEATMGGGDLTRDFVSRINQLQDGHKMSQEYMIQHFRETFGADSKENMIAIDEDGFAHTLIHGERHSVGYTKHDVNGRLVVHNHPNDGAFSRADLRNLKEDGITGIVATGKTTTYEFRLGKNFKYEEFDKALTKSPVTDRYSKIGNETNKQALERVDKQTTNWLRANQKRYGYTFKYTKGDAVTFTSNVKNRRTKG